MFLLHILFAFSKYDKIVLEKVMKELRLLKVIVTSGYWWSWRLFNEDFWRSQTLLRWSMIVDWSLIYLTYTYTHTYIYKQVSFKEKNLINLVEISNRFFHGLKLDGHISEREKWSILCTNMKKLPIRESYISYLRFTRDMMYQ